MGNITKSLWTNIKNAILLTPAASDRIPFAASPFTTNFSKNINYTTPAAIVTAGAAGAALLHTQTILTDAQIRALPTTGVIVVPAVASVMLFPVAANVIVESNGADYGNFNADCYLDLAIPPGYTQAFLSNFVESADVNAFGKVSSLLAVGSCQASAGLIGVGSGASATALMLRASSQNANVNGLIGEPLTVKANNLATGDFNGGDATNRMIIDVWYFHVTVPAT